MNEKGYFADSTVWHTRETGDINPQKRLSNQLTQLILKFLISLFR